MDAQLEKKIRDFLRAELGIREQEIAAGDLLVTSGLVDSAGLVRLAAVLERETGLLIPDRDLTVDHFDSIERILAYVANARRS